MAVCRLTHNDFHFFYRQFREVLAKRLGTMGELFFLFDESDADELDFPHDVTEYICGCIQNSAGPGASASFERHVVLFLKLHSGCCAIVVDGCDPYFVRRVSADWLVDFAEECQEYFLLIKRAGTDSVTGLLDGGTFSHHLQQLCAKRTPVLLFVEVYPKAKSSTEAKRHMIRTVSALVGCCGDMTPLYALGNHVYAILSSSQNSANMQQLAERVVLRLRKEGIPRIHIGLHSGDGLSSDLAAEEKAGLLVAEAETALAEARRKGPFALCDYSSLSIPSTHPLRKPGQATISKLRRRWQGCETFCILDLQPKDNEERARLLEYCVAEDPVEDERDVYLLQKNMTSKECKEWLQRYLGDGGFTEIPGGIACFPQGDFSKSSTIVNSRKALLHAKFYGPGGVAVFNGISCNISGDVYYAEGDLRSAIKEYKQGLVCAPKDSNLLNSLGVAYADIGSAKMARECFQKVLRHEKGNFMALYNLGLGYELGGVAEMAIHYYEEAMQHVSPDFPDATQDLQFHLGRLYCQNERFDDAISLLLPWYESGTDDERQKGKALALLGQSYFFLDQYNTASHYLQRALHFDEFDALSMGILGYLYLLTGEGNEIALSLCRKAVDLDPAELRLRAYLGNCLVECGRTEEARQMVKRCLAGKNTKQLGQLVICKSFLKEKRNERVRFWLKRLETSRGIDKKIDQEVGLLKTEYKRKGKHEK